MMTMKVNRFRFDVLKRGEILNFNLLNNNRRLLISNKDYAFIK